MIFNATRIEKDFIAIDQPIADFYRSVDKVYNVDSNILSEFDLRNAVKLHDSDDNHAEIECVGDIPEFEVENAPWIISVEKINDDYYTLRVMMFDGKNGGYDGEGEASVSGDTSFRRAFYLAYDGVEEEVGDAYRDDHRIYTREDREDYRADQAYGAEMDRRYGL